MSEGRESLAWSRDCARGSRAVPYSKELDEGKSKEERRKIFIKKKQQRQEEEKRGTREGEALVLKKVLEAR